MPFNNLFPTRTNSGDNKLGACFSDAPRYTAVAIHSGDLPYLGNVYNRDGVGV